MRNRIARAFAVFSCGCLLLGSCEADRISVETGEVGKKLTLAAAGVSAAAVANFDKVLDKAEQQGLLHLDADVERKLQDAGVGVLDASVDAVDTASVSGERAVEDGSVAEQKADGDKSAQNAEKAGDEATSDNVNSDSSKNSENSKSVAKIENAEKSGYENTANSTDVLKSTPIAKSEDKSGLKSENENSADNDNIVENSKNSEDSENKNDKDDKNKAETAKTYGYKNIGIANVRTSLNVRESASKSSRRIGSMLPDAACEIKGYEGDWAKIKSGDVVGYVMASYLLTDEEAEARADVLMSDTVTVNADVLRVRESASINSRIITRVNGGTKLVLADAGDSGAESVQNSEEKQEQSGAPPGDESKKSSKSVEKIENSDDFAAVKVKDSIEVAKNDAKSSENTVNKTDKDEKSVESGDGKSDKQTEKSKDAINTPEKAPPDEDAAFDDATAVRAVDEIGDNGWVEIELGNGRYGYVSTDYVEVSTELETASALYAPDPIDETAPAVTVADVTVSENVTVATERVEDDVSADSDSGGDNDRTDDPGGGASEDDAGIAEAPEADTDGGDADVTDSENADSSDDGSELTEDEQSDDTDAEEESEDTKKADKGGKKKHKDKTDGNADESQNDGQPEKTDDTENVESADSSDDTSVTADDAAEADNVAPEENTESAPVAPSVDASTSDPASFAMQFLGNPYVWGGSSLTNGADCSGFVMSVYANYGISLPHSSAAQSAYGTRISAAEAVPGDLFFYGSGTINHVGIYVGNGQIIHASNKRTGIKLSSAYYQTPVCVTRLVN